MSSPEIYNSEYGFVSFDTRLAQETDYIPESNYRNYWLRTPGHERGANIVDYYYGDIHAEDFMLYEDYGVRPVITVSKNYHIHSYITETVESTCTYRGKTDSTIYVCSANSKDSEPKHWPHAHLFTVYPL